jgi:RNA polymerase sigma-70 factor (ECF subfamily)
MELYERYGPALLRKAERVLQNRDDACDVVQELFVDLLSRGQTSAELPYLYRAVTNRCLNVLRDRSTHQRLLERQQAALRGPARTTLDERVVSLDLLTKLSARLDGRCQEVLVYRYIDDMTQEEIAALTGFSRKTVGKRLDRVRAAARALGHEVAGGAA